MARKAVARVAAARRLAARLPSPFVRVARDEADVAAPGLLSARGAASHICLGTALRPTGALVSTDFTGSNIQLDAAWSPANCV